jgi:hypothetical protein
MKINFEIVDFDKELKRVEKEVAALGKLGINEKIEYATDTLRIVTPVDTGEARSGWRNEKRSISNPLEEGLIINEVEHIVPLNNGHSKQAPRYFIEQVLAKVGILTPD